MCWDPHLNIAVPLSTGDPSIATRLTLKGQSVQAIVGMPGCCWVSVVQALTGAPSVCASACLKHNAHRTRTAVRTDVDIFVVLILGRASCKTRSKKNVNVATESSVKS